MLAKRALEEAAFSMRQIADRAGLSYAAVRRWKTGARAPEPDSLLKLADAFEGHASELRDLAAELRAAARRSARNDADNE